MFQVFSAPENENVTQQTIYLYSEINYPSFIHKYIVSMNNNEEKASKTQFFSINCILPASSSFMIEDS